MMLSSIPLTQAIILVPMLAAVIILMLDRYPNAREAVSLAAGILIAAIAIRLYSDFDFHARVETLLIEPLPGLSIAFQLDELGMIFALVASLLWPITTLYALGYMRAHNEPGQTQFYAWFAIAIGSTMAIAMSANLFTLFVFYELLTLSTYPLVTHGRSDAAKAGGRLYLGMLLGTSIAFFLLAIVGTWLLAGTLTFTQGGVFPEGTSSVSLGFLLVLFVFGIGKAAIMPFHRWLPAAMVAPTPVSALLHAVAVVKAGVFTLLKVCTLIFGIDLLGTLPMTEVLMYLAAASILVASLIALRQDNLKKRLAYSTVSQLNYIVLGALMSSGAAIVGSAMHIAMHAVAKITL
ncbi:MAG: proton-conducting transporter membrane subunit, partial [Pseudomonadales bacterium]